MPGRLGYAGLPVLPVDRIRNFSIISHVDHGKSTLSDRILELTGAVDPRQMREQYLDSMDIERERGITIKAQNVRVPWKDHTLHLIDTPGHVDFGYEVSRSLAACEGAVLLVDASQGIQAQTLANCYQALDNDLEIVAVLNKIDLPAADPDRCAAEIEQVLGLEAAGILHISAKTGEGVPELLDAIVARIPPPSGDPSAPLQALIFDSAYDQYRGVVSSIRVMEGTLARTDKLRFMQAASNHEIEEIGIRTPVTVPVDELGPGEVGYLIAGIKDVGGARSGETVTTASHPAASALAGYRDPKPMVFCGLFPIDGDELPDLRDALEKLRLNDASFTYEPESSRALGLRLPVRVPRPAAHGDRPGAARAGVRPLPHRHRPVGGLPGLSRTTAPRSTWTTRASCPSPASSTTSTSPCCRPPSSPRPSTPAPSWTCARAAGPRWSRWSTSPRSGWSSSTPSPWPRWWSTSSTS